MKVPSTQLPAQFHRKFWGKDQQWSNSQLSDGCAEGHQISEDERVAKGDDVPMDADDIMDAITDDPIETTDMDKYNDIIPGCGVLDIGLGGIGKIWVRAEYMRIYNCLEEHYNLAIIGVANAGAVLTGQPGIGEFFLIAIVAAPFMFRAQKARVSGSTMPCAGTARKGSR